MLLASHLCVSVHSNRAKIPSKSRISKVVRHKKTPHFTNYEQFFGFQCRNRIKNGESSPVQVILLHHLTASTGPKNSHSSSAVKARKGVGDLIPHRVGSIIDDLPKITKKKCVQFGSLIKYDNQSICSELYFRFDCVRWDAVVHTKGFFLNDGDPTLRKTQRRHFEIKKDLCKNLRVPEVS